MPGSHPFCIGESGMRILFRFRSIVTYRCYFVKIYVTFAYDLKHKSIFVPQKRMLFAL
jgi:hypothetical protein